jgi:hypothetical protein
VKKESQSAIVSRALEDVETIAKRKGLCKGSERTGHGEEVGPIPRVGEGGKPPIFGSKLGDRHVEVAMAIFRGNESPTPSQGTYGFPCGAPMMEIN